MGSRELRKTLMLRVTRAGAECFRLCRDLLDGILLVRTDSVLHNSFCTPWYTQPVSLTDR